MSARYEIIDQGCRVKIICPDGSVECFDPSSVGVPNLDDVAAGAIRQQSADIAELRAELAAVVAERDEWKECAMSNLDERDQLRAQLAEYENAPTVAVVWFARNKDGVACSGLDYTDLPPIGTELIASKVKK